MRGVDFAAESRRLEAATPEERLAFAMEVFGDKLLFTSSFGAGSGVLLHLWSRVARHLPVVFLDTGFLFDETLAYRDRVASELGLTVETVRPAISTSDFVVEHGADIYLRDPDFCCATNKVAPLEPYRRRALAWVSREADAYMAAHAIPEHPMKARRYLSIGCAPCTSPVPDGGDERDGRWAGTGKTECGLHTRSTGG